MWWRPHAKAAAVLPPEERALADAVLQRRRLESAGQPFA